MRTQRSCPHFGIVTGRIRMRRRSWRRQCTVRFPICPRESEENPGDSLARHVCDVLPGTDARAELLDFAELMRELEVHLVQSSSKAALVDPQGKPRPIPDEIFRILEEVTNALAAGEGITIVPQGMIMTTLQAADFLGISRPTFVRLLEAGEIASDKPGRHSRVQLEDLIATTRRPPCRRRPRQSPGEHPLLAGFFVPERTYPDGHQVVSLGCDNQDHNAGVLDLEHLTWSWLATPPLQPPWQLVDWDRQ